MTPAQVKRIRELAAAALFDIRYDEDSADLKCVCDNLRAILKITDCKAAP
jgi:hypothetical protein